VSTTPPKGDRIRRPTRAETRTRLLDAAAEVFIERGISAATVEDIADAAHFSRGAVYSNFADKDELVLALLQRMTDESIAEIDQLMAEHPDPDDYIRATQAMLREPARRNGHHHPVLSTELVLYSLRNPHAQPLLKQRLDRSETAIWKVVERNASTLGLGAANNRRAIAAMITAMDDGFGLHAIIDPARDPVEAFNIALDFLAEAGAAIAAAEAIGAAKRRPTRPTTSDHH
jgi:AcrR family transcriptional regulator